MQPIDGRALAVRIQIDVAREIQTTNVHPKLGVLLVGDDPASHVYVNLKEKACASVGILSDVRRLPAATREADLVDIIRGWNDDPSVHAVLVQIPLPKQVDQDAMIRAIDPRKDVDGFHPENYAALLAGTSDRFPPVHEAALRLVAETGVTLNASRAVILGNSETFTSPLKRLLEQGGAIVDVFGAADYDREIVQNADIIVVAVGRPRFLTRDLIKSGAVVIDVGTNRTTEGLIVGDVDAERITDISGWYSPVPGGVGPVTVAILLKNVFQLAVRSGSRSARDGEATA